MSSFFERRYQVGAWRKTAHCSALLVGFFMVVTPVLAGRDGKVSGALTDFGDPNFQASVARPLALPGEKWTSVFRWLHIGDSHTAGDYFTGELRRRLQARYGDAGIGWITPGYVFNQRSDSVLLTNEGGWSVERAARKRNAVPSDPMAAMAPFGGHVGMGATAVATTRLTFKNPSSRQLMRLSILQSAVVPYNGGFDVATGDSTIPVPAALPGNYGWIMTAAVLDVGGERLWIKAAPMAPETRVAIGGLALEKLSPGVVLDAVGANGAQYDELLGWNREAIDAALTARPANLVVLAYGTNEALDKNFEQAQFIEKVTSAVRLLRQTSKKNSPAVMLMLPPDVRVGYPSRRKRKVGCGLPPANLARVNAALTLVARKEKTLLWDWGRWVRDLRGHCGMASLAHFDVPLARPDLMHLTPEGYRASAASLLADLLRLADVGTQ